MQPSAVHLANIERCTKASANHGEQQEMGGSILFKQRLGFSGTPSELMPRELGQCEYEPGSEGEVVSTLTSPSIVSFKTLSSDWTVEALLDAVAEAACRGECQALIDTGVRS
eukprot:g23141.t1